MAQPSIAFIGTGNMAGAILEGLMATGYPVDKLWATRRQIDKLASYTERGVNTTTENHLAIEAADIVVISVKPQMMRDTLTELAPTLQKRKPLLISVAAGISCDSLERWAGGELAVIRSMPNTPSLLKLGASGLFANPRVTEEQKAQATSISEAVGIATWCDTEEGIDQVTAVSGSGPAYFFLMMEKMIEAAQALGMSPEAARQLTIQTAKGAAEMAAQTGIEPAQLRKNVTSPGGTTEQAINSFEHDQLGDVVLRAMSACKNRAAEMSEQLGKD
ncbi:MAG: pyrroline-5-carboxylate reductase [Marinobacterium sp.]